MRSRITGHARQTRARARPFATLAVTAVLSGCSLFPGLDTPQKGLPYTQTPDPAQAAQFAALAWWAGFHDPELNRLVAEGAMANLSLKQALERVRAADAVVRRAGVQTSGDFTSRLEETYLERRGQQTEADADLGISWLIDIFGQNRFQRLAALRGRDRAVAEAEAARLIYLSQITLAYVDMRFFEASAGLRQQDLRSRRRTLRETNELLEAGEATQLELSRAQGLLANSRSEIPALQAEAVRQKNRIATLLGRPAGTLHLDATGRQPVPKLAFDKGIPADLVRNRPDVRAAEQAYAEAVANLGVAKTQLYPSLRLNGTIGIDRIDGTDTSSWTFGPTLNIPIFNRRALNANVEIARAEAEQAHLAWRQSVLTAIEEVRTAMFALRKYSAAVAASQDLVRANTRSLDLSRTLVSNNQLTLLEVIDSERTLSYGRAALAANLSQLAREFIALNVALGAGYAADRADAAVDK